MDLDKTIRKVLKEELINFDDYSKIEKAIKKIVDSKVNKYTSDLPDNYYTSVVDIYDTQYGKVCHISFLYKKPFKEDDVFNRSLPGFIKKDIQDLVTKSVFSVSYSRTTIELYKSHQNWYDEMKKKV